MNAFVHHPLVILRTAVEAFSYMMTCEITISVGALGAFFVPLGAMVSKLFTNWTIYANKVTFSFCSLCLWLVTVTVRDSKLSFYQINLNLYTLNLSE